MLEWIKNLIYTPEVEENEVEAVLPNLTQKQKLKLYQKIMYHRLSKNGHIPSADLVKAYAEHMELKHRVEAFVLEDDEKAIWQSFVGEL